MGSSDFVPEHDGEEQQKLDAELHNIAHHGRQWNHEPGEIYFTKDACIGNKRIGGGVQAGREIIPDGDAAHVKQNRWHTVCRDLGDVGKHHQKHHSCEQGLYEMPQGAQDGLFVLSSKITLHEHPEQVSVFPDFLEVDV